jgi:SAM-dependent methyltransferase
MSSTQVSFRDKWHNNPDVAFAQTLREGSEIQRWILSRNGFGSLADMAKFLSGKRRVLDAGCGNGRVTALLAQNAGLDADIVGIDFSSAPVAAANLKEVGNIRVEERDLLGDLSGLGPFDFIYCQEVLHHTANPPKAFANLAALLAPGGEIAIYVYKKKAPVREFTDDFLRMKFENLGYEEAMKASRAITEYGRQLAALNHEITVPASAELDIPAGTYSVQRFMYHFFMKCFWSDELSFEENTVINYDWYHPQLATRHTLEEVRQWFADNKLDVRHEYVDEYGITMRGTRR